MSKFFPGAIPVLDVYDVTLDWWLIYARNAEAMKDAQEKAAKKRR